MLDVAGELNRQRASRTPHPKVFIECGAALEDYRHGGERDYVVHDRRLSKQTGDRRNRRLVAHHPALALETLEHRGLLAADVGAGAEPHFEIEGVCAAGDLLAQVAALVGCGDRLVQRAQCVRIFRAQVDIALGRARAYRGDRHAFEQDERVALHDHAVGESAGITLVRVADDVFLARRGLLRRAPFDPRGKACATAPAQSRLGNFFDDFLRRHRKRAFQSAVAAVRDVILQRDRIDNPHAREGQPLLALEITDLFRQAEAQAMTPTSEKTSIEKRGNVGRRDRPVGDTAAHGLDLNHRLQPEHPA